jgi:hypothetical protein
MKFDYKTYKVGDLIHDNRENCGWFGVIVKITERAGTSVVHIFWSLRKEDEHLRREIQTYYIMTLNSMLLTNKVFHYTAE